MAAHPLADDLDAVLDQNQSWASLRKGRLFITGGTGFFGTWLLESFAWANDRLQLGARATVLSRDPSRFAAKSPHLASRPDISFISGDVTDFAFPPGEFDFVIHAATEASAALNEASPIRMSDTIVAGTRRVLEFARVAKVRRVLLTSSGAIYGRQPPEMSHVDETFAGGPEATDVRSAYAESKRMAEWLCCAYANQHELEVTIARCFAFVGPYLPLDAHFAIGNFIRDAVLGREIVVSGDGTPWRSYLYASDLMVWLWTILSRGVPGRAYNVGSASPITIGDLAKLIAEMTPAGRYRILTPPTPGAAAARYVPSVSRAMTELGLSQHVQLLAAIERTMRFAAARIGS